VGSAAAISYVCGQWAERERRVRIPEKEYI